MVSALRPVSNPNAGGLFINSCYAHCQTTARSLWNSPYSPKLNSKVRRCITYFKTEYLMF
jgi:hypothetical protein